MQVCLSLIPAVGQFLERGRILLLDFLGFKKLLYPFLWNSYLPALGFKDQNLEYHIGQLLRIHVSI